MYHRLINEEEPEDHSQNDQNFELKNRHKERRPNEWIHSSVDNEQINKVEFISHIIKPNETLQGIALRYACTVSKLRQLNHLASDNAFHGLSTIKIPVIKNSVLKEKRLGGEDQIEPPQFVNDLVDVSGSTNPVPTTKVVNIGISNYLHSNGSQNYQKLLNNLSEDFKEIRKSTLLKMENSSSSSQVENAPTTSSTIESKVSTSSAFMSCDGSDFGISWRCLLLVLIIVSFLVPLYVLFNLEHHNSTNSHTD